ncbi:hypothetical protein MRX96_034996 [Rhipicephalus microplus]
MHQPKKLLEHPSQIRPLGVDGDSFFCTTSLGLVPITVPADGICDYVFFDSLYTNGDFQFIDDAPKGELLTFLTVARTTRKTEYGCGINVRYTSDARSHLRTQPTECMNFLQALINSNIIGFGVLSINKNQFSDAVFQGAVALLSELKAFLLKELGRDDLFTLIGIYISGTDTKDMMTKFFSTVRAPDVIIGLGHIAYVTSNMTNCEMLPHSTYNNTQKSQQLRAKYGSLYELGCDGIDNSAIQRGVPYPFQTLTDFEGARIYNGIKNKYYAFDNAESLVRKYCKAQVDLPGVKFGLAAYDVNYDNGVSNSVLCEARITKIGDFIRVQVMSKLRDSFRNQVFDDVDECFNAVAS